MVRQAVNILVIGVVLGCPFIGLSEAWGSIPDSDACCADARGEPDKPAGNCPNEPRPGHVPENCFCSGAILEAASGQPGWQPELPAPTPVATVSGTFVVLAGVDIAPADNRLDSLLPLSGRQILALIERFQL